MPLDELFETSHPVALVTGSGAPRIGNHVVRRLAEAGCHTVVHAHRSQRDADATANALRRGDRDSLAVVADLTVEADIAKMFALVDARFGRLDILVNCASTWGQSSLETTTADDVRREFEINTLSTFLCCQQAGLRMVRQDTGGAIVNIGDWAIARPYRDHAAYFVSKGAIPTLTRSMAVELGARNPRVRVNAILPGPVLMPTHLSAEERQATIDATLVKREGGPECIAQSVLFLVENEFVTGVSLPVDGGRTIYAPEEPNSGG